MAYLNALCISLVSIGIIIMLVAIRTGLQVNRTVPAEFTRKWFVITLLMLFFLVGYCGFIVMQLTDSNMYLQLITSLIFFGGALFVLLIINLSRLTITQLTRSKNELNGVNEDLWRKTKALETKYEEQTRTQQQLQEAKTVLENIFNSSIPICITSTDYEIVDANEAYYKTFGEADVGDRKLRCYESRPGPACKSANCPLNRIVAGELEVVDDCAKTDGGGRTLHFIVTTRPYHDADGKLVGIVESFQDITMRKHAENLLALEKNRLAITLRSIADGVITTDLKGNILMLNRVAEKLCGWDQEEAAGNPLEEVYHIVDFTTRKRIDNPVTRVIKTGKPIHMTPGSVLVARDGWERFITDSAAPILDQTGNVFGVVLVFRDISEKRQLETEITKLEKLKAVGLLAGGIAHDFNNLLTAILGNISMVRLDPNITPATAGKLENAEAAVIKAKDLTQQLLTFSKGGEPRKKCIDLGKLLRESVEFGLRGSNTLYTFRIDPDIWPVEADSGQIAQAVNNLILNADQAMPEGGTITVLAQNYQHGDETHPPLPAGRYVKVAIIDQGSGILAEHLPFIFDPYFTTKKAGNGLGLSTVYSMIKRHGGFIEASSEPGASSTFTFYLPASSGQPQTEKAAVKTIQPGSGRILVMDDDPAIRNISGLMLQELGYVPFFAENGEEALQAYQEALNRKEPFDCVILDLTIPGGMGGKQTIGKLLELDPAVRAVVSSGYSNDPVIAEFDRYGFKAVVNKPYSISELSRVLKKIL